MIRINGYPIDIALSENHEYQNTITKNPVEEGADVTDHIRVGNLVLRMEGLVSDTPIGVIKADPSRTALATNGPITGNTRASMDAYERLKEMNEAADTLVIECSLGTFRDMAIQSLSIPRTAKDVKGLRFTVTFEKIRLVTNNRTTVTPSTRNGGRQKDLGLRLGYEFRAAIVEWRKAFPPGSAAIIGMEKVYITGGKYYHGDKTELSPGELKSFQADQARDNREWIKSIKQNTKSPREKQLEKRLAEGPKNAEDIRKKKKPIAQTPEPSIFGK